MKNRSTNASYAVWDADADKATASSESTPANACQVTVFTKCHACQTGAVEEGIIANAGHAVGDGYARQTETTGEGKIKNASHAVWDGDTCQTDTFPESLHFDTGQLAIFTKCHTCQTAAIIEGPVTNTCHTVGDDYTCQTGAPTEGKPSYAGQLAVFAKGNACQIAASPEGTNTDACHVVGNGDTCQTATSRECRIGNDGYTVFTDFCRNHYVCLCATAYSCNDARFSVNTH